MFIVLVPVVAFAYEPSAMSTDGRVLRTTEKPPGPWHADVVKSQWGDYPFEARSRHREGTGWFRLELRPDGSVATVKVMQSTGTPMLDQSAIAAFQRWRFKPGKWKWVDEPMWFSMHGPRGNL
jgi:protein TonB